MSFTAYAVMYIAPPNEHWQADIYPNVIGVEWDNPEHTGVKLLRSNGFIHMSSPFPIKVTRWAALIPMYLSKP